MSSVLFIGEYQLRNLIKNQVVFLYLDLRTPETRVEQKPNHSLFRGSQSVSESTVISFVQEHAPALEQPIILICENGEKSTKAATELDALGYKNVFVLRGGTQALDLTQD